MKHFSDQSFLEHIECVPFHVSEIFDGINDVHWAQNHLLMSVIEICKGKTTTLYEQ